MRELSWYTDRHWDVVVIGGGATGAGVLRDLALRGVRTLLLEQRDLAHGTSSRFHGLLHSGARYVLTDPDSARECVAENQILRHIGEHCIEPCGGLFVRTREDVEEDPAYEQNWKDACVQCGIKPVPVDIEKLGKDESGLTTDMVSAYQVPDAAIDGFRLVWQNVGSAERHGGFFRTYTEVVSVNSIRGEVSSVTVRDVRKGECGVLSCSLVINAAGSWVGRIGHTAGIDITIHPDRGVLLAFNHRLTNQVINRLRKPGDGDILVPHGSISILGTTSSHADSPDDTMPHTHETLALLELGRKLFPALDSCRILRAFAGTRPLYTGKAGGDRGRDASRNFVVLDHKEDGLSGMITVCGGKLTTCRLMAEHTADLACAKLDVHVPCRTAKERLLEDVPPEILIRARRVFPVAGIELARSRLGKSFAATVERLEAEPWKRAFLCECERVTIAEFEQIASEGTSHSLNDIRRRTRVGMGTCQGSFCGFRAVGSMAETGAGCALEEGGESGSVWKKQRCPGNDPAMSGPVSEEETREDLTTARAGECFTSHNPASWLRTFQEERWAGIRPVLWGNELREVELSRGIYGASLNINGAENV